ncbi:MAG: UDP-N-acetylmuramoyl-L-alanine--D-glutamate ligase [Opitutales bacterium]|jgi:UDP-N-acetylmuramoylalanine--D-glutamate ligase|nr:UDP-N-acetylmuramoyl-L-alanine--D-glutamate ligase [Opitutales bacterium]MDP4777232.1 UDP-N-acetylmuramoyl-L-alanine--D-glutamate ligase [Opitutales bacterium]MDP4882532.1 UDP-N-acetylmuramoyl-L-alanine--D-glutamate ligase [Opitutales bacterium]MDP5080910.1 UDP-N-acetylmuramoyl-L-alanine--D-glutamate ligase [Opitutales bacterium]
MSKKIAILGAGISGQAARRLAASLGHEVSLFDQDGRGDSDVFTASQLETFDTVVVSPGFGLEHPWRQIAVKSDKACFGELGFAARHWKGKIIAVTGTNGKSTLTKFLTQSLQAAGHQAVATGNIGYPLSDAVLSDENTPKSYAVCEISSFQAEMPFGLELDALLWTNFAEDHLDRYESMSDYFYAKARLFDCLAPDAVCVLSPQVSYWMNLMNTDFNACSVAYEDPSLIQQLKPSSPFKGFPQTENICLAAELWWLLDLPIEALIETANNFELSAHRLKREATWNGVNFWNDSKATNFHATLAAINAVPAPIHWIGGGRVKGGDVELFAKEMSSHITAAYVYGEVGRRLAAELEKWLKKVVVCDRFEDAVLAASKGAVDDISANVLLSPGFSSFDQFSSYEERGKCFIDTVLSLNGAQATV